MHPNLLLNPEEIEEVKQKVARYPWAGRAYASLKAHADQWTERSVDVPETGGGFYHDADPTHYLITLEHYRLADAARDLALMYQFTGEACYRDKAQEIVLAYAAKYLTYEIHDKAGRTGAEAEAGGRTTPQGINEAVWVISLAWAYDLIYNDLTPAERQAVERQILRPAAELIRQNNEGRHNHQTWYNAGVGVIGFVLGDEELIGYALDKADSGHHFQMQNSVTGDGMWYEASMHYQFFVLRALLPLLEAAYHAGIDLYQEPAYKRLFDFILDYADSSMKLPTINDGLVVDLLDPARATYFENALRRLGDPRYAAVLRASPRTDLNALLYGVAELPAAHMPAWRSRHFDSSGLAVLRAGDGERALQAILNTIGYQAIRQGSYQGGFLRSHSHADQLGLIFYGLGQTLIPDAGSIKYRVPAHVEYFKQSVAHNILVLDGKSQEPSPPAALQAFVGASALQVVRASTDRAYPGVRLTRTLLLTDDYLIDIARADSADEHMVDWILHNVGAVSSANLDFRPADETPGQADGYQYLTNIRSARPGRAGRWQLEWQVDAQRHVRLDLFGKAGDIYFLAESPIAADQNDEIADYTVPALIARRTAANTEYLSIIQPYRSAPPIVQIAEVTMLDARDEALGREEASALRIERAGHTDLLLLARTAGPKRAGSLVLDGRLAWVSYAGDKLQAVFLGQGTALAGDGWSLRAADPAGAGDEESPGVYLEFEK